MAKTEIITAELRYDSQVSSIAFAMTDTLIAVIPLYSTTSLFAFLFDKIKEVTVIATMNDIVIPTK